ncbi:MAG: penicillin-binding transpeptidase domain-containing protein [Nitrospirae bacterium]|nr:penicillin-binding transpeptidase domain-containing protein [Nitrospirota bacterium]MCL5284455.1 penicillin-binding transpeptidase domain-containing protein [Nitrospirota bacterium]
MLDPISRALLSRIFVLLLLSLALYRLPAFFDVSSPSSSGAASLLNARKSPAEKAAEVRFVTNSFLPQSFLSDDPSFLTKNGVPVIRILDNIPSLLPNYVPQFSTVEEGHFVTHLDGGYTVVWTVDPELQTRIGKYIRGHRVPYGFFVAENPKNGRLLAFWGSRYGKYDGSLILRATYPAASLFKIITTTDALSQHKITPDTRIYFHGCLYCIGPAYWHNDRRRDRLEFTVAEALGRSINTVFAKIALRYLSPNDLRETASRYGFNHPIRSDLPIDQSHADIPDDLNGFAFCSAGFGDVGISPIHAAAIAGALSNDGVMMKPHMVEKILDRSGRVIFQDSPEYLSSVTSPTISKTMISMMRSTVIKGTGHRAFFRWRFNPKLRHILVSGKTGTLTGKNPAGHYVWFIGTASNQDPTIAVAALTIDQGIWTIKGPDIASKGMYTFFNEKHSDRYHG